jgi:phage repressor protein C with HTH and peptisase S24 domain
MENISHRLKSVRQRLGINQDEMGELLGVTGKYVSMLERGYKDAGDHSTLSKLLAFHEKRETMLNQEAASYVTGARARLKAAREAKGMTPAELAKEIGYSDISIYQNIEEGRSQMGEKMAIKAAKILGIDVSDLMDGSDHPVERDSAIGTFGAVPEVNVPPGMKVKYVPLIALAQCGPSMAWDDGGYTGEGFLTFNPEDPKAFAVTLAGDSMIPRIEPGDVALVYPSRPPKNGGVVIARLNEDNGGDVMLKLYQGNGERVTLSSYNPAYPPMQYSRSDFAWIYPVAKITKDL